MKESVAFKSIDWLDKDMETLFKKEGYVIIDLLTENQLEVLRNLYQKINSNIHKEGNLLFSSGEHIDELSAREIDAAINKLIAESLKEHFENYETLMAAFIVKPPKQESSAYFEWHQDLSFVDETSYSSAQVWIPLQDTNRNNGNLQFITATHSYNDNIRTAPFYPSYFKPFMQEMKSYAKDIPLKAGQAVIFNHKLLHASTPNYSSKDRLAVITTIKPKAAQWFYFTWNDEFKKVSKYRADLDFFVNVWTRKVKDETKKVEEFSYQFPQLTVAQFKEWKKVQRQQISFFRKIKIVFKL